MAVNVRIPTQLRQLTGGASEVSVEGTTVAEALKALDVAHPGFAERLYDDGGGLRRFVNVFVAKEGEITWEEGCLSIPEVYGDVNRAARVVVRATGLDGKEFEVEGTELFGVCMQHEIDHLHGRLFIDHLSFLKKRKAMRVWDEEKGKYPELIRILQPGVPSGSDGGDGSERL